MAKSATVTAVKVPLALMAALVSSTALAADDSTFFVPPYSPQMMRFTSTNTPAHQAARHFMRGVNLDNYFEASTDGIWTNVLSAEDFQAMKREGFDHVRISARWSDYAELVWLGSGAVAGAAAVTGQLATNPAIPISQPATQNLKPGIQKPKHHRPGPVKPPGGEQKQDGRVLQQAANFTIGSGARAYFVSELLSPAGSGSGPKVQMGPIVERSWDNWEFKIKHEVFDRTDFAVTNALNAGLAVIVGLDHFEGFTRDPTAPDGTNEFLEIWERVAHHYAGFTNTLAFELLSEPRDAASARVMNPIYAQAIAEIRKTNPARTIFVGAGIWDQASELTNLVLPANDNNLIVAVHCYQPSYFTFQSATWAGPDVKALKGIQFPGPPTNPFVLDAALKSHPAVVDWIHRYNTFATETNPSSPMAFVGELRQARAWSAYYGRPVHVGEFGCYTTADAESRARYYAAFRQECDQDRLGWAIWDWSEGFRYWDKSKNEPVSGMHKALFGKD